jgi:hypothetical protein
MLSVGHLQVYSPISLGDTGATANGKQQTGRRDEMISGPITTQTQSVLVLYDGGTLRWM